MDTKRVAKYTKWTDIYNTQYRVALNNLKVALETATKDSIINCIHNVYNSGIHTLLIYLRNNGFFKHDNLSVIKESIYIDFIEDGEDWIKIYEILENSNNTTFDFGFINKCVNAFIKLDEKFLGAIENDC